MKFTSIEPANPLHSKSYNKSPYLHKNATEALKLKGNFEQPLSYRPFF